MNYRDGARSGKAGGWEAGAANMRELLAPVFVQVALTFVLLVATGTSRLRALRRREVRVKDIALGQQAWPERATQISRSFQNQLELPVLFYVAVVLAIVTGTGGQPMGPLAWGFVAARLAHAAVHVTSNVVSTRFYLYIVGMLILAAMWGLLAVRAMTAAGSPIT